MQKNTIMRAIRLQATIQELDIPYIERFLKGIATNVSFENEEDDFFYELTDEDIKEIAIGRNQLKQNLGIKNEDVFNEIKENRNKK